MTRLVPISLSAFFLQACLTSEERPSFGVGPRVQDEVTAEPDSTDDADDALEPGNDADALEDGEDGSPDPAEEDPVEPDPSWDASPPQAALGMQIHMEASCGFMSNVFQLHWEWDGLGWKQVSGVGNSGVPRPELFACLENGGDKRLSWFADGSMYLESASLAHVGAPSPTADRWMVEVAPLGGPSTDCERQLEEAGVELPVMAVFELVSID